MKYRTVPTALNFKIVAVADPATDREARVYDVLYDTWAEAHNSLVLYASRKLTKAQRELDQARGYYEGVRDLKDPSNAQC